MYKNTIRVHCGFTPDTTIAVLTKEQNHIKHTPVDTHSTTHCSSEYGGENFLIYNEKPDYTFHRKTQN